MLRNICLSLTTQTNASDIRRRVMDYEYRVTITCPWHEVKAGGFPTALSAYECIIEMDEISRDDVLSVKIERVNVERQD